MAGERDMLLDPDTGDLDLANGGTYTTGEVAIRQELVIRYRTFLGEYFLDDTRGVPWLTWATSKMPPATLRQVEALLLAETLATKGIVRVEPPGLSATFNVSTKTVTVVGTAVTDEDLLLLIDVEI